MRPSAAGAFPYHHCRHRYHKPLSRVQCFSSSAVIIGGDCGVLLCHLLLYCLAALHHPILSTMTFFKSSDTSFGRNLFKLSCCGHIVKLPSFHRCCCVHMPTASVQQPSRPICSFNVSAIFALVFLVHVYVCTRGWLCDWVMFERGSGGYSLPSCLHISLFTIF